MTAELVTRTAGTGSSAQQLLRVSIGEKDTELDSAMREHARIATSTTSLSIKPVVVHIDRYESMIDELAHDARWAELLNDASSFDLLERLAEEALAEDEAGLTLDLDNLLS